MLVGLQCKQGHYPQCRANPRLHPYTSLLMLPAKQHSQRAQRHHHASQVLQQGAREGCRTVQHLIPGLWEDYREEGHMSNLTLLYSFCHSHSFLESSLTISPILFHLCGHSITPSWRHTWSLFTPSHHSLILPTSTHLHYSQTVKLI